MEASDSDDSRSGNVGTEVKKGNKIGNYWGEDL